MLVDDEKEEFGELEIEQQKIEQKAELPEKYRDKSLDEIVKSHYERTKHLSEQLRLIKENQCLSAMLASPNFQVQEEEE